MKPEEISNGFIGLSSGEQEQLDRIRGIRERQSYEMPLYELRRLADLQLLQRAAVSGPAAGGPLNADAIKIRIGQNINKLRKECGWSFSKLADKTGIDKKAIISHVKERAKPHPKTLREYAQAFAKELNRPITANNLEE